MGSLSWDGAWKFNVGLGKGLHNRRGEKCKRKAMENWNNGSAGGYRFPLKQAVAAGSLALAGDAVAQLRTRWVEQKTRKSDGDQWSYDWIRALRMTSYGFLLYGPGSQAWYEHLDRSMPLKTARNLLLKVFLNQTVLGPAVILVIFAWNNIWQGRVRELPSLYKTKAVPTLVDGWKFWIPASALNFSVVPLEARVAFMSCCSIFWNFYLSTTMGK